MAVDFVLELLHSGLVVIACHGGNIMHCYPSLGFSRSNGSEAAQAAPTTVTACTGVSRNTGLID